MTSLTLLSISPYDSRRGFFRFEGLRESEFVPTIIRTPSILRAAGTKPKTIQEFVGRVNSKTSGLSVARMDSPAGWIEPGQTPEFDEYTVVLRGAMTVRSEEGEVVVEAGQAFIAHRGEWVQYSTPGEEGAEYVSVCVPAFSPETVHRDEE